MSKFRVGDFVEVVGNGKVRPEWQYQIGMCGLVVGIRKYKNEPLYSLDFDEPNSGWGADSLRLKRPPNWNGWLYDTSDVKNELQLCDLAILGQELAKLREKASS